jgi:hypothetical protein
MPNLVRFSVRAVAACSLSAVGLAATLTSVPMQGTMVMPMLAYHSSEGSLSVQIDPTIPELTPLLVSNPGDSFDPADPWYDYLDPSRQGLAFSRRYGFVMDTLTDPLPAGTALWIRKLSSSPGLGAYRYRSGASKQWTPIFGTEGVTNALQWDGTMFHPAFTAPPGTGTYTATFEAWLLDTASGLPVPGTSTGPFTFTWTVVPDGRPTLSLAVSASGQAILRWPAAATNWVLEAADTLPSANWTVVTSPPVRVEDQNTITLETTAPVRFFRMRLVP